jgi:hypothetical protein
MNDSDNLKRSALNAERTRLLGAHASKEIRAGLLALCAAMALVLLNGCASTRVQEDADPWQYNPNTGYPAVGGPPWHL